MYDDQYFFFTLENDVTLVVAKRRVEVVDGKEIRFMMITTVVTVNVNMCMGNTGSRKSSHSIRCIDRKRITRAQEE
jgi:hypothetical protein